jgi:hypothetical protein
MAGGFAKRCGVRGLYALVPCTRPEGHPGRHHHRALERSLLERFNSKVVKPQDGGCWTWVGARDRYGYGHMTVDGKIARAHRIAYALFVGELDPTLLVLHSCNRGAQGCVTPSHIRLGTHQDNMDDAVKAGGGPIRRGARNHFAKLTEQQVLAIRSDRRSQSKIARDYCVDQSCISNIKTRRNWSHL